MGGLLAIAAHPSEVVSGLQSIAMPSAWIPGFHFPYMKELLYTGLLSTDFVLIIELMALRDVPSTDAAVIYTMEPVLGSLLAYVVLGERWGALGWVGAALILASSLVTQLVGGEEEQGGKSPRHV